MTISVPRGLPDVLRGICKAVDLEYSKVFRRGLDRFVEEIQKSNPQRLSDKQFKALVLTHSSLTGSDLLRALCLLLEIRPNFRRSDNVAAITQVWKELGQRWPEVIIEEAQNFSAICSRRAAFIVLRSARHSSF